MCIRCRPTLSTSTCWTHLWAVEYKAEPWHSLTTCIHCADCTTASGEFSFQDVRGCATGCLAGGQGPIPPMATNDYPLMTSPLTQGH